MMVSMTPFQSLDPVSATWISSLKFGVLISQLVIQGTADVKAGIKQEDVSKAVEFTSSVVAKPNGANGAEKDELQEVGKDAFTTDEVRVLKMVKNVFKDFFAVDSYFGMVANLERGHLGLVKAAPDSTIEMKQPVAVVKPVDEIVA